jgi:hypothetical protein
VEIDLQTTVFFMIVLDQLNQHLFLDIGNLGRITLIAFFKQGLLALEENPPLMS